MFGISTIGIACNCSATGGWMGKEIKRLPGPVQHAIAPLGEIASIAMYQPVPIGGDWFIRIEVGDDAGNADVRYVTVTSCTRAFA